MQRLTASCVRLAAVTVAVAGLVGLPGQAAAAGGPTSVLLVSPAGGSTASLYYTNPRYDQLEQALGKNPTADKDAPDLQGGPGMGTINVTWLAHDVLIWRVDRVFVDVAGGPWVETRTSVEDPLDTPGTVHRASDPALLLGLLDRLGLIGPAKNAGDGAAGADTEPVAPAIEVPAAAAPPAPADGVPGWQWLVVGLAGGALAGAGARPAAGILARYRGRRREDQPPLQVA